MISNRMLKMYLIAGFCIVAFLSVCLYLCLYSTPNISGDISKIVEHIHKNYADKSSYWGLDSKELDKLETLNREQNQIINSFGKTILVGEGEGGNTVMPGEKSFDISFPGLSKKQCVYAATAVFDSPITLGLLQMQIIIGNTRQAFTWGADQYKLPVVSKQAAEFCSDNATVVWTFE